MNFNPALLGFVLLSCTSCAAPPFPPADLDFVQFVKKDKWQHMLTFTSNIDFLAADWKSDNRSPVTPRLQCSLDDDTDFSIKHTMQNVLEGSLEPRDPGFKMSTIHETAANDPARFSYTLRVNFISAKIEDSHRIGDDPLLPPEINRLLANRTSIPCKIVMPFYFSFTSTYYSKIMDVPVKALLDEVNK
jgi:hypothetical protein